MVHRAPGVGSASSASTLSGRRWLARLLTLGTAALVVAGCGSGSQGGAGSGPTIIATTDIWADVVRNVACEGTVEVRTLVPPGADPHSISLSLADRARLADAVLVVANGLGLEGGLDDTLDDVEGDGGTVLRMGDHVPAVLGGADGDREAASTMPATTTTMPHDHDHAGGDDDHDHAGGDPHIWFDPVRVRAALPALADAVAGATDLDAEAVQRCAERYAARLDAVDAEIAALVEGVPAASRRLVTSHGALAYFADRYGFSLTGTVLPGTSTLARASPADVESLARRIDAERVPAIFTDSFASDDDVSSLVHRLDGVVAVPLLTESLGEPGTAADSYTGLLLTDAARIVEALRGDHAAAGSV